MSNKELNRNTEKEMKKWRTPKIITIKKEELQKYVLASACSGYGGCSTLMR